MLYGWGGGVEGCFLPATIEYMNLCGRNLKIKACTPIMAINMFNKLILLIHLQEKTGLLGVLNRYMQTCFCKMNLRIDVGSTVRLNPSHHHRLDPRHTQHLLGACREIFGNTLSKLAQSEDQEWQRGAK